VANLETTKDLLMEIDYRWSATTNDPNEVIHIGVFAKHGHKIPRKDELVRIAMEVEDGEVVHKEGRVLDVIWYIHDTPKVTILLGT